MVKELGISSLSSTFTWRVATDFLVDWYLSKASREASAGIRQVQFSPGYGTTDAQVWLSLEPMTAKRTAPSYVFAEETSQLMPRKSQVAT